MSSKIGERVRKKANRPKAQDILIEPLEIEETEIGENNTEDNDGPLKDLKSFGSTAEEPSLNQEEVPENVETKQNEPVAKKPPLRKMKEHSVQYTHRTLLIRDDLWRKFQWLTEGAHGAKKEIANAALEAYLEQYEDPPESYKYQDNRQS